MDEPEETSTPSIGTRIASWFGSDPKKKVGEELFVKPLVETAEACKSAFQYEDYQAHWAACKTGAALGVVGFTGGGKVVGIGVRTLAGREAAEAAAGNRWTSKGCFKSFSGETLVEMGDGSHKPILEIEIGDEVLATDPETGERGPRKVTHL